MDFFTFLAGFFGAIFAGAPAQKTVVTPVPAPIAVKPAEVIQPAQPVTIAPRPVLPRVDLPTGGVMHISEVGLRLIELFESCRLKPYQDGRGIWTVGWGHALTTVDGKMITDVPGMQMAMNRIFGGQTITQAQADERFRLDLSVYEKAVVAACKSDFEQSQFDAMVSLCFNCGVGNFGRSSVVTFHNLGKRSFAPYDINILCNQSKAKKAPADLPQAFTAWSQSNHVWVLGLFRRRVCEVMVYRGDDVNTAYHTVEAFHD